MSSTRAVRLHPDAGQASARLAALGLYVPGELGAGEVLIELACSTIGCIEDTLGGRAVARIG